ncbi:MAG TPA: RNA polymerase subunit sigma-24 [Clostridiales bacterium]|nr:RNA polymerase subunit sigma-24 [Clostridiales bacterium]
MESSISMSGKKTESKNEKIAIDAGRFKQLYEAHYKQIYNYISLRINNHWDTGDLVSQVFEKLIEKYPSYRPDRGNLEAWLMGIAKNTVNDYYRKKQRRTFVSLEYLANFISLGKEPEEILVVKESNAKLIKALSKLSRKEREIMKSSA